MKNILEFLYQHKTLTKQDAKQMLMNIAEGKFNEPQIASFLTAFNMRNITLEELIGFREALLELCVPVNLSAYQAMDLCGTGGDGKNTFNISTLASFIVAGSGICVAKHGNYGVSSASGSSNVLEALGVNFFNTEDKLKQQLDAANICFIHAPLFHPAMKQVGPVRKAMGVKTFFNMLGPLVNPAKVKYQLVGVFNLELARMYQYIFQQENHTYTIVHGLSGFDEISLTDKAKIITNQSENIIDASYFNMPEHLLADIFGGNTVAEAAEIFTKVITGKGTAAQNNVVIANAALAIATHQQIPVLQAVDIAKETLLSGKALQALNQLKQVQ